LFNSIGSFKDVKDALDFNISIEKNQNRKFTIIPNYEYFLENWTYKNKKNINMYYIPH
jgi:hypothetical protein